MEETQTQSSGSLESLISLRSQYDSQILILTQTGILKNFSNGAGMEGLDPHNFGQALQYPVPSFEAIQAKLQERAEVLAEKVNQGFKRLLLVPLALPLDRLKDIYGEQLKLHYKNRGQLVEGQKMDLLDSYGNATDLDTQTPVWAWSEYTNSDLESKLLYLPHLFDWSNHGAITKMQLIEQSLVTPFAGWAVELFEEMPNLPATGAGKIVGGRPQLEPNKTPIEYLSILQSDPSYQNERGITPEEWLALAITELKTSNRVLDDYQGKGKISFLLGAFFPASANVPYGDFNRHDSRAGLYRDHPDYHSPVSSARTCVPI